MKLRLLLTALIAIPCLLSCNREEESIAYSIELDASYVSFDAGEDEKTVNIVCNSEWTLSTDEDDRWCRASAYKGRGDAEITFKAEPNMATEERSLTYVFQAGDKTEELLVIQDGHVYSISIDSTEFRLDAGGGERKVAVTSSDEWTLEVQEEWCVPSVTSGVSGDTVVFSVDNYLNTEESRTATVTFSCGDKTAEMTVTQEAKVYSLSVEPEELVFEAGDNDGKPVLVSSSDGWTLKVSEDWCVPSAVSGNDGDTVTFSVEEFIGTGGEEEKRKATATFTCGDKMAEVLITQGARIYSISVEPEVLNFEAEPSGELAVQVSSSDEWTLEVTDDWCTPSVTSGQDGDSVSFSVTDWLDAESGRSTTATFTCGNRTAEVLITQGAKIYSVSVEPEELTFEAEPSGEQAVMVSSSDEWTLEVADDWCTPSVTSGQDGDSVSFSATDWLDAEGGRSTTATFTCGNKTAEVLITQGAKIYSVSVEPEELTFEAEPSGEQAVMVSSSDEWTLEVADDWCTPSVTSGQDGDSVSFSATDWLDAESGRSTTATFSCGNKTAALIISQNAKAYSISVSPTELIFEAEAGGGQDVTVSSSDEWTLEVLDNWCYTTIPSSKDNNKITFWCKEHLSGKDSIRTTRAIFSCGDKNAEVVIKQKDGYDLSLSDDYLIFEGINNEEQWVKITSSGDWNLDMQNNDDWCTPSVISGKSGDSVSFTVDDLLYVEGDYGAYRSTYAIFTCGDKQKKAYIGQSGKPYHVSAKPDFLVFEHDGSYEEDDSYSASIVVKTKDGDSWSLKCEEDWVCPSRTSGQNGDSVIISLKPNQSLEARTTDLIFISGIAEYKCHILQRPLPGILLDTTEYFVDFKTQSLSIPVLIADQITVDGYGAYPKYLYPDIEGIYKKVYITVDILYNSSDTEAHRTIRLYSKNHTNETITITQGVAEDAPLLYLSSLNYDHNNPFIKALCDAGLDSNNDGYISYKDAQNVTDLDIVIHNNPDYRANYLIESSDFNSLKSIKIKTDGNICDTIRFNLYSSLESIDIYSSMTSLIEIDNNHNLSRISIKNCAHLESIEGYFYDAISDINLSGCSALKSIPPYLTGKEQLTNADFSGCTSLSSLDVSFCRLSNLNLKGCSSLQELSCQGNLLTQLYVSDCISLTELNCFKNKLVNMDLSNCTALQFLRCEENQLTDINLSNCYSLQYLDCSYNQLPKLDLNGCTALNKLYCYGNRFTKLDLSHCSALTLLSCGYNQINELNLNECTLLKDLYCSENQLTILNLTNCTALRKLFCGTNQLSELDLRNCSDIIDLSCESNNMKSIILNINTKDRYYIKDITDEYGDIITFVE